jgi:hypothetical protein
MGMVVDGGTSSSLIFPINKKVRLEDGDTT